MTGGVFFDLGGTLFSYRNVPRTTLPLLLEAVERLGVTTELARIKDAYNQAQRDITHAYAERSYYLHRDFFHDTFMRFADLLDAPHDEAVHDWYREAHRAAIVDCLVLKDDCMDTLAHLREAGLYLSVVSNIDDDMLAPLIEREGLGRYFHHWTSSEAARSCKPHRRFFEYALELSGLDPAQVLFVGDSPEHDIAGANMLGMRTALIIDGGMEPPLQTGRATAAPDHVIHTLAELRALVGD
ncbi:MAG: HAD family hydrolase [Gammaproteobacteria bacterium]